MASRRRGGPGRGSVWWADLDPVRGTEQRGDRPIVVVSVDEFNASSARRVIACPITTNTDYAPRWYIKVQPPDGGLDRVGIVMCDQVRALSVERLRQERGTLSDVTMEAVDEALAVLLGLD
jgi:mRNA interferase MazF